MVRTASRRGGTPSKTKKAKTFKPKPRTPKVNVGKVKPATIPVDPALASEALERIALAERELQTVEEQYKTAKVSAREYKAVMEKKRKRLHEIIDEETGNTPNLFAAKTLTQAKADGTDESWRDEPMSALDIAEGTVGKLREEHITTVGEYCDYLKPQANGFQPRLTDIKGIGAKAVTSIEDAIEKFFAERKAAAKEVVDEVADATVVNTDLEKQLADESDADADPEAGDE